KTTVGSFGGSDKPRLARRIVVSLAIISVWTLTSNPALAFKWSVCPSLPLPVYPSEQGATNSLFVHPGHELRLVLNQDEAAATGGFSLEADGNVIAVPFVSLFGDDRPLAPRTATADSPTALRFRFPDTRDELGDLLAGPVEITVWAHDQQVA